MKYNEGNVNIISRMSDNALFSQINIEIQDIDRKLSAYGENVEKILFDAISKQNWFTFKNQNRVVFDKRTGLLFPNFHNSAHIKYRDWKVKKESYAPDDIGMGSWEILSDIFYYDEKTNRTKGAYYFEHGSHCLKFDYPSKFKGRKSVDIYISKIIEKSGNLKHINFIKGFCYGNTGTWYVTGNYDDYRDNCVFPVLRVLNNPKLLPDHPSLIGEEKSKIILNFFVEKGWFPKFEPFLEQFNNEYDETFKARLKIAEDKYEKFNIIFDLYYKKIQLQKKLLASGRYEEQLVEPTGQLNSHYDYRVDLNEYSLIEIKDSIWKYSQASQQWISNLLNRIDEWENEHLDLVKNTVELNQELEKKLPVSINVTAEEKQLLEGLLQHLKKRLDLGFMPLRSNLINLLSESQQISSKLEQANTLIGLAQLEKQARPSFELLAEHTAILCTKTLKEMEWLDESLEFVKKVVSVLRKSADDYLVLVDKYQQDLVQIGLDNSIETEEIAKWFAEWRSERLTLLKQIQPLLDAGLNKLIDEQTVLDVLQCIEVYQNELDQFYLQKRLGIHTTYAFQPNGHRQEKLEKEQALTKLVHQFMQQLEKIIFNTQTTAQKIWLIRFSEVWQQGVVNEITDFLAKEQLIERDDVVQIMSEELRKVQQQNLASCLQDAQSYSEALAQREKDVNTLIFKMRKALMK